MERLRHARKGHQQGHSASSPDWTMILQISSKEGKDLDLVKTKSVSTQVCIQYTSALAWE